MYAVYAGAAGAAGILLLTNGKLRIGKVKPVVDLNVKVKQISEMPRLIE